MRSLPFAYVVDGLSGESIAAGGSLGPIKFAFPDARFVTGLLVLPRSGDPADLASLSLEITDETGDQFFAFRGGDVDAPALALFGGLPLEFWPGFPQIQPLGLQRPVMAHDVWRFTITNNAAAPVTPVVILLSEDASR